MPGQDSQPVASDRRGIQGGGLVVPIALALSAALIFTLATVAVDPLATTESGLGLGVADTTGAASADALAASVLETQSTTEAIAAGRLLQRETAADAFAAASSQRVNVEILAERTGSSSTWATPSGDRTTEYHGVPFRTMRDGEWVDADGSLAMAPAGAKTAGQRGTSRFVSGNVLEPRVALAQVRVSAGGEGSQETPLGEVLTSSGRSLALFWPQDLPPPEVSGPQATYEVSPDAELEVTARDAGFQANVVLAERPARLPVYRFPIETTGVTLIKGEDGGYAAVDAEDRALISIAPPVIFDSSPVNDPDDPDAGPIQTPLASELVTDEDGRTVLELRPGRAYLDDATYPVTVDPRVDVNLTGVKDSFVKEGDPTAQFQADPTLRVGYTANALKQRSYLLFQTPSLAGKNVISSTLKLRQVAASSCTASTTFIYPAVNAWNASMTWNSGQPSIRTEAQYTVSRSFNNGASGCPNAFVAIDVKPIAAPWLLGSLTNNGFALRAATSETGSNSYKAFCSFNSDPAHSSCNSVDRRPVLLVTYNSLPQQPLDPSLEPAAACATGSSRPFLNTAVPFLTGSSKDDDGDQVRLNVEVWPLAGSVALVAGNTAYLPNGALHKWQVPAGKLTDGSTYKWRARGDDGTNVSSQWSTWCEFTVDRTIPTSPSVASADYPAGAWSAASGQAGVFTLTPRGDAAGTGGAAAGIRGVLWSVDDPTPKTFVATTGPAVNVTATPTTDGPHTLYVSAVDKAGNTSTPTAYSFKAGAGGMTSPAPGDRTARRFALAAEVRDAANVTFQYRRGDTAAWTDIQTVPVADGKTASSTWDAAAALGNDGLVQLRASLEGGTSTGSASAPIDVTVDRVSSETVNVQVGPGQLNTLTGDYVLSATDVSVGNVSITRTARSRIPNLDTAAAGLASPFGPNWAAGGVAEVVLTRYLSVEETSPTSLTMRLTDARTIQFTRTSSLQGGDTEWEGEPGSNELTLTGDSTTGYLLSEADGTRTRFTAEPGTSSDIFAVTSSRAPGNDTASFYDYEPAGPGLLRLKRAIGPSATADTAACNGNASQPEGCRVLELDYADATTVNGQTLGDFDGRVTSIRFWDRPPGASEASVTEFARYTYDATGSLREQWDPRISPPLKTAYRYDSQGRVVEVGEPGQRPHIITYGTAVATALDDNPGRLLSVSRATEDAAYPQQTYSVVYDVPLHRSDRGPHDMRAADVAKWGQTGVPTDATAVYAPGEPPASNVGAQPSYDGASIYYLDVAGREVNVAGRLGGISSIDYNQAGQAVRELEPANHELSQRNQDDATLVSLGLSSLSGAQRADLLSTSYLYEDGQYKSEEYFPLQQIVLDNGQPALARRHVRYLYDQGRPDTASTEHLVTSVLQGARVLGSAADVDVRVIQNFYDWDLGVVTRQVTDPSGLNIETRTDYDTRGRAVRNYMPSAASSGSTSGADSTVTEYYTATGSGTCGNQPAWDGLVCQIRPGGPISGGGGNPTERPSETRTYTPEGLVATIIHTANGTTRTIAYKYDAASRLIEVRTSSQIGAPVPLVRVQYDPLNGEVRERQEINSDGVVLRKLLREFDDIGRMIRYTDASGGRTDFLYDGLDRLIERRQFANGTTPIITRMGYDLPGGVLTRLEDDAAGVFTMSYDVAGRQVSMGLPGEIAMTQGFDSRGAAITKNYRVDNGLSLYAEDLVHSVHQQVRLRNRADDNQTGSSQEYFYDAASRLIRANDQTVVRTAGGEEVIVSCQTRQYTLSRNTTRTGYAEATSADVCPTPGAASTLSHDSADRRVSAGYSYDTLSRAKTAPSGTSTATLEYFANDLLRRHAVGENRQTWEIDPANRYRGMVREQQSSGAWEPASNKTYFYDGDGDAPAWVAESGAAGDITRYINLPNGGNVAKTGPTSVVLPLTTVHGDIAQSVILALAGMPTGTTEYSKYDEFGLRQQGTSGRYGWLGAFQRSSETTDGRLILMGRRVYDPTSGSFLSIDPIQGGGKNAYDYAGHDPLNLYDLSGEKSIPNGGGQSSYYYCGPTKSAVRNWLIGNCRPPREISWYVARTKAGFRVIGKANGNHCTFGFDKPSGFNFIPACDMHDYGYALIRKSYLWRSSRGAVDSYFYEVLKKGTCQPYNWFQEGLCKEIADEYYNLVKLLGGYFL